MMISVVIPLYNKARYIRRAIESVLKQTYTDYEIVVVDDGSTDNSVQMVEQLNCDRIKLVSQDNAGVSAARNRGIQEAAGEWIAFLDADDEWLPEKLERQISILKKNPDLVWVAGNYIREYQYYRVHNGESYRPEWFIREGVVNDVLDLLAYGNQVWTSTVLAKKEMLSKSHGFDVGLTVSEDIDLWVRIGLNYPCIGWVLEPVAIYYTGILDSLTISTSKRKDRSAMIFINKLRQYADNATDTQNAKLRRYTSVVLDAYLYCLLYSGRNKELMLLLNTVSWCEINEKHKWRMKAILPGWFWFCQKLLKRKVKQAYYRIAKGD